VARRGEVLELRRRIGFGGGGRVERFVVLQADHVTRVLGTVLAAPLDDALSVYSRYPGALPVTSSEAGTRGNQVLLLPQLSSLALDRFEPDVCGKLRSETLRRAERTLKLLLELS
jgi:mRNA-degrading endonuclease toxin of MazEF toxin-antitoxin module